MRPNNQENPKEFNLDSDAFFEEGEGTPFFSEIDQEMEKQDKELIDKQLLENNEDWNILSNQVVGHETYF